MIGSCQLMLKTVAWCHMALILTSNWLNGLMAPLNCLMALFIFLMATKSLGNYDLRLPSDTTHLPAYNIQGNFAWKFTWMFSLNFLSLKERWHFFITIRWLSVFYNVQRTFIQRLLSIYPQYLFARYARREIFSESC